MRLENNLKQEKWRTLEDLPRFPQRTFIKRVWPTRIIRASLLYKLEEEHHNWYVPIAHSSSFQRKISFEEYARKSSNLKYPLSRYGHISRKCFFSLGVVGVCCRLWQSGACVINSLSVLNVLKPEGNFSVFYLVSLRRYCGRIFSI